MVFKTLPPQCLQLSAQLEPVIDMVEKSVGVEQ